MERFDFSVVFEQHIEALRIRIKDQLKDYVSQGDYTVSWKELEKIAVQVTRQFLSEAPFNIPTKDMLDPSGKSKYPDLKVLHNGQMYAIEIKTGQGTRSAYDIGRLDTYEESRIAAFAEEYAVMIWCEGKQSVIVKDVFIEPVYNLIGHSRDRTKLSMRLYDGKLRPKSWASSGKITWNTKQEFLSAFYDTRLYRWYTLIPTWYFLMTLEERLHVRTLLDAIDKDTFVPPQLPDEEDENGIEDDAT